MGLKMLVSNPRKSPAVIQLMLLIRHAWQSLSLFRMKSRSRLVCGDIGTDCGKFLQFSHSTVTNSVRPSLTEIETKIFRIY
jgi:hypothetical protein